MAVLHEEMLAHPCVGFYTFGQIFYSIKQALHVHTYVSTPWIPRSCLDTTCVLFVGP